MCQEKLREWRRQGTVASLLSLRKAYLQVHVSKDLQRFQTVKYCYSGLRNYILSYSKMFCFELCSVLSYVLF